MFWLLFISYIILTSLGLILLKLGGQSTYIKLSGLIFTMQMDWKFVIGMICYAASFLMYMVILQKRDLSYIYPLCAGIVNVVSVTVGIFILKEKVTITGVAGIAAIVIGVILLNIKR